MRAGKYAAEFAKENGRVAVNNADADVRRVPRSQPFERSGTENPFRSSTSFRSMMQELVGIVRAESEMMQALDKLDDLKKRSRCGFGAGQSRVQSRLAHGARLAEPADGF